MILKNENGNYIKAVPVRAIKNRVVVYEID
jgi:hypothetical protein